VGQRVVLCFVFCLVEEGSVDFVPTSTSSTSPLIPPPTPVPVKEAITTSTLQPRKSNGFRTFIFLSIVIIVIIYSVVAYLYFQNQKLKVAKTSTPEATEVSVTPTPAFSPDQVTILNGSVVLEVPGNEVKVLVDKETYESTGITGFARVLVSPNNEKICIESWPPAPEPALYIANVDGSGIIEVSPNRLSCLWSQDSMKIFYVNSSSSTSPANIYLYDIASTTEINLTKDYIPAGSVRRFAIVGLSADASKLMCTYEDVTAAVNEETSNQCEIDLQTNQVTIL